MEIENGEKVLMHKYKVGRLLGKGTFAKVYYAKNVKTLESVALKVIDKEKVLKVGLIDQTKREVTVMRMVRHANVVQLYEVMATKSKIYFVLEYVKGGELFKKIAKGGLKEGAARKYFQQLISAVDFCHSRGVYHRDLKPENLLLDDNGNLKVSDFGLSALVQSQREDGLLHTTCGTPAYVAPEVISRKGYDGAKSDIWSCGVILFVLMAGYLPFCDQNMMDMYKKIGKADFKCPNWFPSNVRKLLVRILDPNPNTRISIANIMKNPWFAKGLADKLFKNCKPTQEAHYSDADQVFGSSDSNMVETNVEMGKLPNLNAFDLISLSTGFDLSGLFEERDHKKEARFASDQPASTIISKLEDIARLLKLKVKKKDHGVLRMEGSEVGRRGVLAIDAEIFEVTPNFHLVEIKTTDGDSLEYGKLWKQDIRPALKAYCFYAALSCQLADVIIVLEMKIERYQVRIERSGTEERAQGKISMPHKKQLDAVKVNTLYMEKEMLLFTSFLNPFRLAPNVIAIDVGRLRVETASFARRRR
ncbi:CBL-interacting protein kinase 18 [Canna indica]|uniref:non-specific serine/threonine protein kinase n=1 Tax=Canna indica TaxID=4628 RepID=A0AAQ3K4F7_9LILI|nr:CBL-interacting protein kinase 18 [Canna indica]